MSGAILKQKRPMRSRMTVVGTVYVQAPDGEPQPMQFGYARTLDTDEQCYERNLKVGEEWQALDCGWVKEAAFLAMENREGRFTDVNPTEVERREALGRVVEVSFCSGEAEAACLVPPGESLPLPNPVNLGAIKVRCRQGVAKCYLKVVPR